MSHKINVVIFEGGASLSSVEKELLQVRKAVLQDNIHQLLQFPRAVERVVLVTNYEELLRDASFIPGVEVHRSTYPFHFGKELYSMVAHYCMEKVLYLGSAVFPLLSRKELNNIFNLLLSEDAVVCTNNVQSSDLVAFSPGETLGRIPLPAMDNSLAVDLRDYGNLPMELLPPTSGVLFDLDTPTDYMVLGCLSTSGPRTREALRSSGLDLSPLEKAIEVLEGYYLEAALVGRVGAPVIAHINNHLKLRLRIFSEERGMKALGRLEAGEVESLLGHLMESAGLAPFFNYLERVARVAFIDSRVLFAHFKLNPSVEERFLSDLGRWEQIKDPWIKEFTRLSTECDIPVILGGHSLVSGGLWALTDELAGRGVEGSL